MSAPLAAARVDLRHVPSLPGLWRVPWIALLLALLATGAMLVPAAAASLQYDRDAIAAGQLWRIFTCHFTHFTLEHFGWCLLATLVLGAACERIDRRVMALALVSSMVLIPAALFELEKDLNTYRGLSGIDSALFVVLLVHILVRRFRQSEWIAFAAAAALGVAFTVKILLELRFGVTFFVANEQRPFDPVPVAHLMGAVAAGGSLLLVRARQAG